MIHHANTQAVLLVLTALLCPGEANAAASPPAPVAPAPIAAPPPPPTEVIPGGISVEVWHHATTAQAAAAAGGLTHSGVFTVIDYSRPATQKRLWVVDAVTHRLLASDYVAHGYGSGDSVAATRFSNQNDSHESSLGTFITGAQFYGVRGRSLPLHGLEPGINDHAYARGLLIHGSPNVSEARAQKGSQGVTEGCAGVPSSSAKRLIKLIGEGSVVFVWYPDRRLLEQSGYLDQEEAEERLSGEMQ